MKTQAVPRITHLLRWLRRLLSLPHLNKRLVVAVFLFVFVGAPMLGPMLESLTEFFQQPRGSAEARSALERAGIFGLFPAVSGLLVWSFIRPVFRSRGVGFENPQPARVLVMLTSAAREEVLGTELHEWVKERPSRWELFEHLSRSRSFLELVVRAAEYHSERLERLILITTGDGLKPHQKDALQALFSYYLSLLPGAPKASELLQVPVEAGAEAASTGFEGIFRLVELLQVRFRNLPPDDVIYDFTPGTKPMSAGMVMACLEDRVHLQYFPQVSEDGKEILRSRASEFRRRRAQVGGALLPEDHQQIAWGQLAIESDHQQQHQEEQGGILPILVRTDAQRVGAKLEQG